MLRGSSIERIAVATDLTAESEGVVDVAIAFALAFDASLELIHIATPLRGLLRSSGSKSPHEPDTNGRPLRHAQSEAVLVAQCARVQAAGLSCITTSLRGRPTRQILSHLQKVTADLLVAGVTAEARLGHVFGGGTGFRLAKGFDRPIVLVPAKRKRKGG